LRDAVHIECHLRRYYCSTGDH